MKLIPTKCPNCGASIEIDALQDSYRCDYCHTNFTDADFKRVEINKTEHVIDEAKIKEQEYNILREKWSWIALAICGIFVLLMWIVGMLM